MTNLEIFLMVIAVAEAIALIFIRKRPTAPTDAVILKPGRNKLRVDYYWIANDALKKAQGNAEEILKQLQRTKEPAEYIYVVEGAPQLVTKKNSLLVSLEIGALENANATSLRDSADEEDERTGAIKPPHGIRQPPGNSALIAVEITVESDEPVQ